MKINVTFRETQGNFTMCFDENAEHLDVNFDVAYKPVTAKTFKGPYEVTPEFEQQTLETKNKLMTKDVVVLKIPMYSTLNPKGGITVTIGNNANVKALMEE